MTLEEAGNELNIDLEKALDRVVNRTSLYIHLLKSFVDDSYMNQARQAVGCRDYDAVIETIHSMKGSAASLGIGSISAVCHNMVTALRQQEYEKTAELFAKVEEEYTAVKAVIVQLEE
ncbi:MAG: Hpt domain-containing protein [Lachnospiraceae bacterium]|nr:Hpt domain-containing protein [Lachnospiraceae bacterium]